MRALDEVMGQELRWVRQTRREFELLAGEDFVAALTWTGRSQALGQWSGGRLRFSQQGWLRPRILVSDGAGDATGGQEALIATFVGRGDRLTFPDGRTVQWKKPSFWTSERDWVDTAANTVLVRLRPAGWRSASTVTVEPSAAPPAEIALLLLLGQYLLLLGAQTAAEASTAAIVPVIGS